MILLCNDDGFNAEGLRVLRKELLSLDDVMIVAPETEQSAMGHAITLTQPLKIRKVKEDGEFIGYAVNGTPADCVKLAITVLLEEPPKLVVSGINLGGNLGICALYSGTVSAATEAMIMVSPALQFLWTLMKIRILNLRQNSLENLFRNYLKKVCPTVLF